MTNLAIRKSRRLSLSYYLEQPLLVLGNGVKAGT